MYVGLGGLLFKYYNPMSNGLCKIKSSWSWSVCMGEIGFSFLSEDLGSMKTIGPLSRLWGTLSGLASFWEPRLTLSLMPTASGTWENFLSGYYETVPALFSPSLFALLESLVLLIFESFVSSFLELLVRADLGRLYYCSNVFWIGGSDAYAFVGSGESDLT